MNSSTNCYTGNTCERLILHILRNGDSISPARLFQTAPTSQCDSSHHADSCAGDTSICSTDETCAEDCCLDGASYQSTYGVSASGDALTLDFVTENSNGQNVGSRTYLMASSTEYEIFDLLGKEFSFDVDVSTLPCGLNGALYFVSMPADGGLSSTNTAGAAYGTGYCDSQCPRDLKFIDGEANIEGWVSSSNNANTGLGDHGSCCPEMVCQTPSSLPPPHLSASFFRLTVW